MTTFYDEPDRFCWPIIINSANKNLRVTEDPGGGNEADIDITLKESSALTSPSVYYAVGLDDPASSVSPLEDVEEDDSGTSILQVRALYSDIAGKLSSESNSTGNGLDYEFTAATPSGSDHTNTGITLQQTTDSTTIEYDFTISDQISPRFFGFAEGASGTKGGSGSSITGDYSRWGMWFSPVKASDKRPVASYETFRSAKHKYDAKTWRLTKRQRVRMHKYQAVAGVHVWPDDRANRSAEADRGGLSSFDRNNALWDLWRKASYGDRKILVAQNGGYGDLGVELSSLAEKLNVAKLVGDWRSTFNPQGQTDREHAGEKYGLELKVAIADDDAYTSNVSPYLH